MSNEHNPIAQLVQQIQQKWKTEVSPDKKLQLVRWIIQPGEARLYEGFLKLESTPHGSLSEHLITLLTPFQEQSDYAGQLITDWVDTWNKDTKTRQQLEQQGISADWDGNSFVKRATAKSENTNKLLLEMLVSFQHHFSLNENGLILALFPQSVAHLQSYRKWLEKIIAEGIPSKLKFMVFDYVEYRFLDLLMEQYPAITKSLRVEADMEGAMRKIAAQGDPNSPEIQFRNCLFQMSDAVREKNIHKLQEWGKKGQEVTQRTGLKSMYSTAFIVYAGMLFNFKQYEQIDELLKKGLLLAEQGRETGDVACEPLIIQYHGYQASSLQLQNKMKEAIRAFTRQAEVAMEFKLHAQALSAYRQAYTLSKKHLKEEYNERLEMAYLAGKQIPAEELKTSDICFIAYDYFKLKEKQEYIEMCESVDKFIAPVFGDNWKDTVEKTLEQNTPKKSNAILTH